MKIKTFYMLTIFALFITFFLTGCSVSNKNIGSKQQQNLKQTHRFVFISDTRGSDMGVNEGILSKTLQAIRGLNPQPEYLVIGGDLVGGNNNDKEFRSQLSNYKRIVSQYYSPTVVLPAVGNHEIPDGDVGTRHEKIFQEVFNEFKPTVNLEQYNKSVYYVDADNVRLIVLNSTHPGEYGKITLDQLEWFKDATNTDKQKFVFVHFPPYPTGSHIGSSLDSFPEQRDKFWQIVDQNNVSAVFSGHEHNYSRRKVDSTFSSKFAIFTRSVNQIVAGTAGAPPYKQYNSTKGIVVPPMPIYHYVVVDVSQNGATVMTYDLDGRIIDGFTIKNNK